MKTSCQAFQFLCRNNNNTDFVFVIVRIAFAELRQKIDFNFRFRVKVVWITFLISPLFVHFRSLKLFWWLFVKSVNTWNKKKWIRLSLQESKKLSRHCHYFETHYFETQKQRLSVFDAFPFPCIYLEVKKRKAKTNLFFLIKQLLQKFKGKSIIFFS